MYPEWHYHLLISWTRPFPRGGAYRLEIISAPSEKVWRTSIAWLCSTDIQILYTVDWHWVDPKASWLSVIGANDATLTAWCAFCIIRAYCTQSTGLWPHSMPINNIQNLYICRTSHAYGSSPDSFRGGAYNL